MDLSDRALGSVSRMFRDEATGDLYVALNYPGTVGHIAAIGPDGNVRKLQDVKGPAMYYVTHLAWDPGGRRLFYTADNNELRDIYELDVDTGKARRIKKDCRIGDLVFNRADRSLWGIRHFNGYASIVRMEEPWDEWRRVLTWPYGRVMYDIDLSPDGSLLVGSLSHINGDQTLITMETDSLLAGVEDYRTLYDFGNSLPANFTFSPDGEHLYGSSYYTGVSNVFRYDLLEDDIHAVTNAETGFFRPTPDGSDSLLAFRYTGEGFVPCAIPDTTLTDVSAITFLGQRIVEEHPVVRDWVLGSPAEVDLDSLTVGKTGYNSFARLGLANVYPIVQGYKHHAAAGVALEFTDPAYVNMLNISVSYTFSEYLAEKERLHADVRYERSGWKLNFRHNWADFYDLFGPTLTSRKGTAVGLAWGRKLLLDNPRNLDLDLGATWFTDLEVLPNAQNVPSSSHQLATAFARLKYRNLRSSLGAVDYEKGWQWELLLPARYVPGTDFTDEDFFIAAIGNLDFGLPLVAHSSIWLRNSAGYSPGIARSRRRTSSSAPSGTTTWITSPSAATASTTAFLAWRSTRSAAPTTSSRWRSSLSRLCGSAGWACPPSSPPISAARCSAGGWSRTWTTPRSAPRRPPWAASWISGSCCSRTSRSRCPGAMPPRSATARAGATSGCGRSGSCRRFPSFPG